MTDHCKDCRHLHLRADKRKWCCSIGMFAKRSIGFCKLKGRKEIKE